MQTISHEGSDSAAIRKLKVNLRMQDGHKRKIKVGRDEGGAAKKRRACTRSFAMRAGWVPMP